MILLQIACAQVLATASIHHKGKKYYIGWPNQMYFFLCAHNEIQQQQNGQELMLKEKRLRHW